MLPFERQELIKTLSELPPAQFEQIVFTLNLPSGIIPATFAPQGERAAGLLAWADKTGPGLKTLREVLSQVLGEEIPDLSAICPYKGLSYFDCNDEDYKYFYGREALTQALLDKVNQDNFLAIVGASGSGKSSVLRAGLLQRLKDKGGYEIRILVPGEHPMQNLALAFVDETLNRLDRAEQQHRGEKLLQERDGLRYLIQTSESKQIVLVVDQFEESFTLCQDESERLAFFERLMSSLELASHKLCLIVAMRSDFVGKCLEQDYSGFADKVQKSLFSVRPMTQDELAQAITEPARRTDIDLEPGLVEAMLNDIAQSPGGLPLLQYTLTELWKQRQNSQLKLYSYMKLGGITGTLKQRADTLFAAFDLEEQQAVRYVFLNLIQLGEGFKDTRRRVIQGQLFSSIYPNSLVKRVIKQLADANLLVTDEKVDASGRRNATVEIAHESLMSHWPKIRQWLDESRELLQLHFKIEQAAKEWNKPLNRMRSFYLLSGPQHLEVRRLLNKSVETLPLSSQAEKYLAACKQKDIIVGYMALGMIGFGFVILIFLAILGYFLGRRAAFTV